MSDYTPIALVPIPSAVTPLYRLSIRNPQPPNSEVSGYTFPLSPTNIQKTSTGMGNFYDVAAAIGSRSTGVQREVDLYGSTPVTYTLEGITGWQRHAIDGGTLTGLESILAVQELIDLYWQLNAAQQGTSAQNIYTMQFHDYFTGDAWAVVPFSPQSIVQDVSRPLVFKYMFRLVGYQDLSAAPVATTTDKVAQAFSTPAPQAQSTLSMGVSGVISNYAGATPGSEAYQDNYGSG